MKSLKIDSKVVHKINDKLINSFNGISAVSGVVTKELFYYTGDLPEHITNIVCYRDSSSTGNTGKINSGERLYYGDTLHFSVDCATGYNANWNYKEAGSYIVDFSIIATNILNIQALPIACTVVFNSQYCTWDSVLKTAFYGDTLEKNDTSINCYVGSTSKLRWTNMVVKYTDTAQYEYGQPTIADIPSIVLDDIQISAISDRTIRSYIITWLNDLGEIIDTTEVMYGSMPTHDTPIKQSTAQYSYKFSHWDPVIVPVSGEASYQAIFTETLRSYPIALSAINGYWTNDQGNLVELISNVPYGTSLSKNDLVLTVGNLGTYTFNISSDSAKYHFDNGQIGAVPNTLTGALSITGSAEQTLREYDIIFNINYGNWIDSAEQTIITSKKAYWDDILVKSGTTITCISGQDSTTKWSVIACKPDDDAQYIYSTPIIGTVYSPVNGTQTITATTAREVKLYKVTFITEEGKFGTWSINNINNVAYGTLVSRNLSRVSIGNYGYSDFTPPEETVQYKYEDAQYIVPNIITDEDNIIVGGYDRKVKTYTITWKWRNSNNIWETKDEIYEYGATPVQPEDVNPPEIVATDTIKYQKDTWDDLSIVTGDREIICLYTEQYKVTSCIGENCTTTFDPSAQEWWDAGTKIIWNADQYYWFGATYGIIKEVDIVPGENYCTADKVPQYTLTATNAKPEFGAISVNRDTSPYARATTGELLNDVGSATIYYGDSLTGVSTPNPDSETTWETIHAPTFMSSTGEATSGNFTVKNSDSKSCALWYSETPDGGAMSLGDVAAGNQITKGNLDFNTNYYCFAKRTVNGTFYQYSADAENYSGTDQVSGDILAQFTFIRSENRALKEGKSNNCICHTAAQAKYTVTFKSPTATDRLWYWEGGDTVVRDVPYGTQIYTFTDEKTISVFGTTKTAWVRDNIPEGPTYSRNPCSFNSFSGLTSNNKVTEDITLGCNIDGGDYKKYGARFTATMAFKYEWSRNNAVYSFTRSTLSGYNELNLSAAFFADMSNNNTPPTQSLQEVDSWRSANSTSTSDYTFHFLYTTRYNYLWYKIGLYPYGSSGVTWKLPIEWWLTNDSSLDNWASTKADSTTVPAGQTGPTTTYTITLYSNSETTIN